MKEIIDWYWTHGVRRGKDESDPDRELRKISLHGWLDPIVKIVERNESIKNNINQKPTLALWGPSQTGKSTMMSRYLDGESPDGEDSGLTWSINKKTRFSPPSSNADLVPSDTLIFNPYNHQSDASGVATRYTLKSKDDQSINVDYPIQLKLTTRSQIILSLALGYLSQCEKEDQEYTFTQESFLDELVGSDNVEPNRDAYFLVKDIADVIENMKGNPRFSNLFKKNEWDSKIRRALVSSQKLLSSKNSAEEFLAKIFWDSNEKLTEFYKEMDDLLWQLQDEWKECSIFASMEVGALILDIDTYQSYVDPQGVNGQKVKDKVSQIGYEKVGNQILISVNNAPRLIAGDQFGYFQALCAELIVPIKKENLEKPESKSRFVDLAQKCDFLDFPGVSNMNKGNNVGDGNATLVTLSKAPKSDLFTKVFKQGKTQCIIYNYVKKYGIDAFAIFVRTDRYPSQSGLLNSGICEWIKSYDSNWTEGHHTDMPVFVNMTFFSSLINNVAMNGVGNGLDPYLERIQGELKFAHKASAKFFATTYHQFPDGKIHNTEQKTQAVESILSDPKFANQTGLNAENLTAVYDDDGGLDYMLTNISLSVMPERRRNRCQEILLKDKKEILSLLASHLPSEEQVEVDTRRQKIFEIKNNFEQKLIQIEEEWDTDKIREMSYDIKKLFAVSADIFDPIQHSPVRLSKREINLYAKKQLSNWFAYKTSNITELNYLSVEQQQELLRALRDSFDVGKLTTAIFQKFSQVQNVIVAKATRFPISLMFANILKCGSCELVSPNTIVGETKSSVLEDFISVDIYNSFSRDRSPYYVSIIKQFLDRLDYLSGALKSSERPEQYGDAELKEIYDRVRESI